MKVLLGFRALRHNIPQKGMIAFWGYCESGKQKQASKDSRPGPGSGEGAGGGLGIWGGEQGGASRQGDVKDSKGINVWQ